MIAPADATPLRESLDPEVVELDPELQSRAALSPEAIEAYAEQMRAGVVFPPIVVYYDGERYWCADGWHRVLASRRAEFAEIDADVREGSRRDAMLHALSANADHGVQRTRADKRRAVELALADEKLAQCTDRKLAKLCAVSHTFVAQVRRPKGGGNVATPEPANADNPPQGATAQVLWSSIESIERYLQRRGASAQRPEQLGSVRGIPGSIAEDEWRATIEQGREQGLWQTSSSIVDGRLIGTIWLPARERSERGADGGGSDRAPVESASPASLSLSSMPPLWAARAQRLLAKLDQGHGGSARLVELRHSARESLGQLGDGGWETLLREGARAGLWTIEGERIRLVRATAPSSDTDTDGDGSAKYSEPDPPGDETSADEDLEDDEQDPDEGPVLPDDQDDPAVQGHRAALEEEGDVWVDCDACGGSGTDCGADCDECGGEGGWYDDEDTDTDTDTDEKGADATPVAAAGASVSEAVRPAAPTLFEQALAKEREHCHEESLRARSEDLRLDLEKLGGKTTLAKLRRACEGPSKSLIRTDYWHAMLGYGLEAGLWVIEGERIWIEKPRISAMPPDTLPVSTPAVSQVEDEHTDLPNDERAKNDAYYTPDLHARALVRWLSQHVYAGQDPQRILEPSVGGGAWLRACRDQWPEAHLRAADINSDAAGLSLADRARVGDFMALDLESADLIVGNPPYGDEDLDRAAARARLVAWIDRSRELAPVVGYLMRSTFLGAMDRLEWWQRRPPTDVIVVLPRPAWEGPGKRAATDRVDSLFIVWRGAVAGSTRLHWLDAKEGA